MCVNFWAQLCVCEDTFRALLKVNDVHMCEYVCSQLPCTVNPVVYCNDDIFDIIFSNVLYIETMAKVGT